MSAEEHTRHMFEVANELVDLTTSSKVKWEEVAAGSGRNFRAQAGGQEFRLWLPRGNHSEAELSVGTGRNPPVASGAADTGRVYGWVHNPVYVLSVLATGMRPSYMGDGASLKNSTIADLRDTLKCLRDVED